MGGECGCSGDPDHAFIVRTNAGEHILIGVWTRTCPGCGTEPLVMAGILSDEELADWIDYGLVVHDRPEMNADACVFLERVIALENDMGEALEHVLEEHTHDREECPEIFTKKGTVRARWKKIEDDLN